MSEHDNCQVEPVEKTVEAEALALAPAVVLSVRGMGCPNCAARVRNGLLGLPGVLAAEVLLEERLAVAAYDPQRVSPDRMVQAVGAAGDGRHHYSATLAGQLPARDVWRS